MTSGETGMFTIAGPGPTTKVAVKSTRSGTPSPVVSWPSYLLPLRSIGDEVRFVVCARTTTSIDAFGGRLISGVSRKVARLLTLTGTQSNGTKSRPTAVFTVAVIDVFGSGGLVAGLGRFASNGKPFSAA